MPWRDRSEQHVSDMLHGLGAYRPSFGCTPNACAQSGSPVSNEDPRQRFSLTSFEAHMRRLETHDRLRPLRLTPDFRSSLRNVMFASSSLSRSSGVRANDCFSWSMSTPKRRASSTASDDGTELGASAVDWVSSSVRCGAGAGVSRRRLPRVDLRLAMSRQLCKTVRHRGDARTWTNIRKCAPPH